MTAPQDRSTDVVVVGAGIVGICSALSLLEEGFSVRMIDRGEPGSGASSGNAGIISPWSLVPQSVPGVWKQIPGWLLRRHGPLSLDPLYAPKLLPWAWRFLQSGSEQRVREVSDAMETLLQSCIELYRKHLQGTGHEHLVRDSYYIHAFRREDAANLDGLGYALRREKGADMEKIDGEALRRLEPAVSEDFNAAIIIKGQARAVSPGKIAAVLADKARQNGADLVQADVLSLDQVVSGGWRIETDEGPYFGKNVVVAAGAWSARLLEPLGFRIPLEAERGYHVEFPKPGIELQHSVMDVDMKIVASSMEDGLRVAGTSEFAGLDRPANEARYKSLQFLARKLLPDLNAEDMRGWMGRRPSLPDGLPILDELPQRKGLFAAFGHCHYGLMMAPQSGQIISGLVSRRRLNADLTPYAVERFTD